MGINGSGLVLSAIPNKAEVYSRNAHFRKALIEYSRIRYGHSSPKNKLISYNPNYNKAFKFYENEFDYSISNNIFRGVNWIYSVLEVLSVYDFNVIYNWFINNIYQDSFDINYYSYWYASIDISSYTLFWSILLDTLIVNSLLKFPYMDEWYRYINASYGSNLLFMLHPEYLLYSNSFFKNFVGNYISSIEIIFFKNYSEENFLSPLVNLLNLTSIFICSLFFIMLFFSYYTSSVKEENTIDHDFLIANISVESEEEVGSFEDLFLVLMIFTYIFLWYFYINCWSIISILPELTFSIYLFPFIYYIIMFIPLFLAFDFGLYFTSYLRGSSASSIMFVEMLYDYITWSAFFIRLIVQNVRLILMGFTFAAFHEMIIFNGLDKELIFGNENFFDDLSKSVSSPSGFTYFLVFKVSGHIIHFFYELFHTLFVLTAQFIAFFAMVFWLFLFLYTMFSSELHEKFFSFKRSEKKNFFKN